MEYMYTPISLQTDVYYRPLARPFPHGVPIGTQGAYPKSIGAQLLDFDDFPSKYERRAELSKLKSKRRLESLDLGMLKPSSLWRRRWPYNSYSTALKPSAAPHYYTSKPYSFLLKDYQPVRSSVPLNRYPLNSIRMAALAPLSYRAVPHHDENLEGYSLDIEADEAWLQASKEAKRVQSAIWQSAATDRILNQCRERNRAREQQKRLENARLLGPIYSRLEPESLGTRKKVLINYHKGAAASEAPKEKKRDQTADVTVTLGPKAADTAASQPVANHEE